MDYSAKFPALFLMLFLMSQCLNAGWVPQSGNTTNTLNSLCFVNSSTGWIAGNSGTILKTTNGGTNWTTQTSGTLVNLNSISFTNTGIGWVCGDAGTVKKSVDYGNTWMSQSVTTSNRFSDVFIVDQNTVYLVGDNVFYRTTNGGSVWTTVAGWGGNYLHFTSAATGFNVGGNQMNKTVNQGTNWTVVYEGAYGLGKVMFPTSNTGYSGSGNGTFIKTVNGGINWTSYSTGVTNDLTDAYFLDGLTGYMIGSGGSVIKTTNGGSNWSVQNSGTTGGLSEIWFTDVNNGWIAGSSGTILHTSNGGVGVQNISGIIPSAYSLKQNYPNPFNPSTKIQFEIPKSSSVKINIIDITGRVLEVIADEHLPAGAYEVVWNASNFPSGIYFYSMKSGEFSSTKKMMLVK